MMRGPPVLEEKNPLPSSKSQTSTDDWDHLRGARERHPQVARHVIRTLAGVDEPRLILRHKPVEEPMKVGPCRGVCVFKNQQTAARMLDEHRGRAGANAAGLNHALALSGDVVCALAPSGQAEGVRICCHAINKRPNDPSSMGAPSQGSFSNTTCPESLSVVRIV